MLKANHDLNLHVGGSDKSLLIKPFAFIKDKILSAYYLTIKMFKLLFLDDSYLHITGFVNSVKEKRPCDKSGNPVPWMNYNIITFLEDRLKKDLSLFEYGSGYSTIFYSNLVSNVVSVEYDKNWLSRIQEMLPKNAELIYKELDIDGDYCRTILDTNKRYDVIIVDGRDRVRCAKNAIHSLTDRGVIIFDDSQRERYKEGVVFLLQRGFRKLDFEGLKPNNYGFDRTTIFYKDNNCLNI